MSKLGNILAMYSFLYQSVMDESPVFSPEEEYPKREKEVNGYLYRVCPKGCRRYFFNANGEFNTQAMLKTECVFECFAINDKTALKKFNNRPKP